ncbi:terminase large subunit [Actinoplanes oblitus]|uniref:Terminase large subunit n=1 Tax=Actinoplanes oblitus TaxID=3040509 RepID=A0ABY8WP33_9ACTN|nr:terminase large subunit [Actinoplanes oblitus]WIM99398.1 terminase large subunit [Actinoplanes oblitus]
MTLLLPQFHTSPLSEDFTSAGPKLRKVFEAVWKDPQTGKFMKLDEWQAWLIDRILETYPPGHRFAGELRYRQVVLCIPRQQGKSLIAACLSFYFLFMHVPQANVIGTAGRNENQAKIVYKRFRDAILASTLLRKEFGRTPGMGMMTTKSGSAYRIYPSNSDALQGEPITGGICDELHLMKQDVWDAVVYGQRAQNKSMLIGLSTAGDDKSELLENLITQGKALTEEHDPESRFGFFMWQAPEDLRWDSPEAVLSCNPAVACGRVPVERILEDLKTTMPEDYRRYTLNWTAKSRSGWMDMSRWRLAKRKWPELPVSPTVAVAEFTPGNTYATIVLAGHDTNNMIHTYTLRIILEPTNAEVAEDLAMLRSFYPDIVIGLDSIDGRDVTERLKNVGIETRQISLGTYANAAVWLLNAVDKGKATHDGNGQLQLQVSKAVMKVLPRGGYRLATAKNGHVDMVKATVEAAYIANMVKDEQKVEIPLYFSSPWGGY